MPLFSRKPATNDKSSSPQSALPVPIERGFVADDTHLAKISGLMTVYNQADGRYYADSGVHGPYRGCRRP